VLACTAVFMLLLDITVVSVALPSIQRDLRRVCRTFSTFTADAEQAVASLPGLEAASADLVLPGHGDPWTDGIQEVIRLVRERAAAARD
jgi:hypothetical protein